MKRARRDPQLSQLIHHSGKYRSGFSFPFARLAVLSSITRANLNQVPQGQEVFPASTVATKDNLTKWKTLNPQQLIQVFKGYFKRLWSIQSMSANQVNIVKTVIHPEMLLSFDFQGSEKEPTVKILDDQQERVARSLGAGHRLVFGVAGSGKTILLIARAKLLARHRPHSRVLVLCYNVTLGAYLAEVLKDDHPAITVMNFHAWAQSNGAKWDPEDDSKLGRELLQMLKEEGSDGKRFDCILVDEAQDFEADWFLCVLAGMKDKENGDLLIVGDGSQGVYRHDRISWKQLGIKAVGHTQYLESNYRNTRQILSLAHLFASKEDKDGEDSVHAPYVDPDKCLRTQGPDPVLLRRLDKQDEVDRVVKMVDDLMDGRWLGEPIKPLKAEQIAILYPRLRMEDRKVVNNLINTLKTNRHDCPVV